MDIRFTAEMLELNIRLIEERIRDTHPDSREFTEMTTMLEELRRVREEINGSDFGWVLKD